MTLGKPIDIGHYGIGAVNTTGGSESNSSTVKSSFTIPTNLKSGSYILYVYLQYPYGITGVFSNAATIVGLDKKIIIIIKFINNKRPTK